MPSPRRTGALLLSSAALLSAAALPGCRSGPSVSGNPSTAYTPAKYYENRLMYFAPIENDNDRWSLLRPYQARDPGDFPPVLPGDPISIVVGDVYLPRDDSGPRDIVVLLDAQTSIDRGVQSYAVWYQRAVMPGQKLGFDSLLVHADREWKPTFPPYFKLRVMDVSVERNAEVRAAFEGLNSAIGSLAAFVPHPAVPAAAAAIRVAGLILSNRQNIPIIDFTSQLYGQDFIANAGSNDLPILSAGSWIAVGRPPGFDETFWATSLRMDRRTGQIIDNTNRPCECPYMRMTISTVESTVPTLVLDRSKSLFDLLAERKGTKGVIEAVSKELSSAVITYQTHARFADSRSFESLADIRAKLGNDALTAEDKAFLLLVFSRVSGQNFKSDAEAIAWWDSTGQNGTINRQTGRWEPRSP